MTKKKYLKFRSLNNQIEIERVCEIIKTGKFYCSSYQELNDPFEGYIEGSEAIKSKLKYNICSFSHFKNSAKDILTAPMWEHYAGGFTGCAIEIEVDEDSEYMKKIMYLSKDDYKKFIKEAMCRSKDDYEEFIKKSPNMDKESIKKILTTKLKSWEYEKEFRFLKSDCNSNVLEIGKITKVYVFKDARTNSNARKKRGINKELLKLLNCICCDKDISFEKVNFNSMKK